MENRTEIQTKNWDPSVLQKSTVETVGEKRLIGLISILN